MNSKSLWRSDEERIDVDEDYALSDWAHRLSSTPQEISRALLAVGDRARDVATHLSGGNANTLA